MAGHGGHPGGAGVEDKWRHTYPYVPTSYYYNNPAPPRQNPESIGGSSALLNKETNLMLKFE